MQYRFKHQWFEQNIQNLTNLFSGYQGNPSMNILEIGSLEGKSTVWFLDNLPNTTITCVDTWKGGADHDPNNHEIDFKEIKENFDYNIQSFPHRDRVTALQMTSYDALIHLYKQDKKFDFIYIDGSHTAIDVNADLVMAWKVLKVNGLIYCDDYLWGFGQENLDRVPYLDFTYDSPKLGIDSWVNVYRNKIRPIIGLQNSAAVYEKVRE